ncbi:MAG: TonB-dependent receptor [Verrucomicrobiaceae bacterium]|jgi:iron complex outermembrane receptor protein|nr:TonB-dependent receptor [Verrucomicrobiaceae bacterium]
MKRTASHLSLLTSFLLVTTLHSQESKTLPEVVITDKKDPSTTVPSIQTRKQQIAATTPGGASVTDAEDYKTGRAATLKDALDFTPGVLVQSRFGAEEARITIRGSGIQRTFHGRGLWLMQDGMPLNLADGGFDMQAIEPMAAQYIETFRGANALQYGAATLGGAINFISHTGHSAPAFQSRFEIGSFNTRRAQISSGFVSGNVDGYVSITAAQTDGFRDWSEQESLRVMANIGAKLSSNLENRFYITWVDSKSQLPGALTKAQFEANPEQAAPGAMIPLAPGGSGLQRRDYQLLRLANKLTYSDGDNSLTFSTFWSWKDLDHPIFQVIDQLSNDVGFDLRYDGRQNLFGLRNDITLGTNLMYNRVEDQRFQNVNGSRAAKVADYRLQSINWSLYMQDRIHFTDQLSLVLGLQALYASRDLNEETLIPGAGAFLPNLIDNTDRLSYFGISPKIGLIYEFDPLTQIYFNASRSYEPPTFGEATPIGAAGIVHLEPQWATTFEIGTRGQRGRVGWDFSYYYAAVDRELLTLGVPPLPANTVNAGKTIHQGVEFGLTADVARNLFTANDTNYDRLALRQNFFWNDFRFKDDPTFGDRLLPGFAPFYYRAELLYEHPCGFYAGPNVEWSPHRYAADLARSTFADPYALLGLKIGYRATQGVSFFVEARNLTDERYNPTTGVVTNANGGTGAVFLPGDGRAFYGGVEFKW